MSKFKPGHSGNPSVDQFCVRPFSRDILLRKFLVLLRLAPAAPSVFPPRHISLLSSPLTSAPVVCRLPVSCWLCRVSAAL
jgi:hypothetical protein